MTYLDHRFMLAPKAAFPGGNQSHADVLTFLRVLSRFRSTSGPQAGGTLTINSQALGSYDYVIKRGNQVLDSFSVGDWFTSTQDSRSALIVVVGNLTIDAAVLFTPSVRKLFTALYVTGNLTVNGEISMSRRGANHSASGSNIAALAIRLATGTFSSVVNPNVPAAGAGAGLARSSASANTQVAGQAGSNGSDGACGGGGSGGVDIAGGGGTGTSGAGAAGTAFSGGAGGGGVHRNGGNSTSGSGNANGGAGGAGSSGNTGNLGGGGGAGNPGGNGAATGTGTGAAGTAGTGGILFIAVEGVYAGSGAISAAGAPGGAAFGGGGGGSGGGSVTVLCGQDSSGPTPSALGGAGGQGGNGAQGKNGGAGGNGSARKLTITPT